ncbi:S8 family peptidase [Nocardia cyriacigeorgica]|uniref:S8 family peptidase n=1 Tax=Nocardia cyriacigeorgica TaxID=135487 RepID=UPI00273E28F1|nr:S8 family peptidase [Nocardia cyriacigeorgica]
MEEAEAGTYITFASFPGLDLALKSLDPNGRGPKPALVAVKAVDTAPGVVQHATVYVPAGGKQYFLSRLAEYVATTTDDKPKHMALVEGIASIRRATIRELWTDPDQLFPADDHCRRWWEVWLRKRDNDGGELDRLRNYAAQNELPIGRSFLGFGDRTVALLCATVHELSEMFELLDDLAELRSPREVVDELLELDAADQSDWARELAGRTRAAGVGAPTVCVLDTGVQDAHPLLSHSLHADDVHVVDVAWSPTPTHPHGTEMAGLALYEDLHQAVVGVHTVELDHRLESVKILPDNGEHDPELHGAITARAIDRPEISAPRRERAFLLAVTTETPANPDGENDAVREEAGKPTSWSAAVDALAFGRAISDSEPGLVYLDRDEPTNPRLFVISAGNIRDIVPSDNHLDRCDIEPVEEPAQAWNALTVGAYTDKDDLSGAAAIFDGYSVLAARGELSPTSRTSVAFDVSKWPYKPDVVAEGGNVAVSSGDDQAQTPDALGILTTRYQSFGGGAFTTTRATSAASAQVAAIAASIMAEYPGMRPETVRALVVHSARWTPAMQRRFDTETSKTRRANLLLRRYGMGVPDRQRALRSASDALTLVTESQIRPFERIDNTAEGRLREMNVHQLPWPREQLEALGNTEVTMRVTLSYFIEPNPSNRGWAGKYAYRSFGLRFEVRRPEDNLSAFRQRVNVRAREKGEKPIPLASENRWTFGTKQRVAGSLHTDLWTGPAVDLANKGDIAVLPVAGWWRDRKAYDQSEQGVHYSLVVSIEAPSVEVDLWTPVAQQIGVATTIQT